MVHNNPIALLMREVANVRGTDADLTCVLSIGAGTPPTRNFGSMVCQVLLACGKLAAHAENMARKFRADREEL